MLKMRGIIESGINLLKDLIFPVFCLSCQKEGYWLCPECLPKIKIEPQFFCPHCYQDNEDGRACLPCRPFSFLDGAVAVFSYENELVAKMIQLLKYQYIEEMAEVFGKLIEDFSKAGAGLKGCSLLKKEGIKGWLEFVILPVPLHRRRYLERGFNQAELLAQVWARHFGRPVLKNILVRHRFTKTQVGLSGEERRQNITGVFAIKSSLPAEAEKIVLVDDVFTTGSTLQECARVLKEAGAREVWGVTIAREV